ncbi:helix-turn-helix domain-containing protein [Nocardia sp. NPDC051570]|uniref:helix-turn-helix domain-containing protein n=1 Tax=Nocardia sp. NPDC051570 TaxID=3364324 RepID=UPI00378792AE
MSKPTAKPTTVPRRRLARLLTELREKRGLSRDAAAEELEISRQTLWRYETGQNAEIKKMLIRTVCELYQTTEDEKRLLYFLQEEVRKDGWWQSFGDAIFDSFELFVALEQEAIQVISFQLTLLPGLVQTAAYRRVMVQINDPGASEEAIGRHLELLAKRQAKLDQPPDRFGLQVFIGEAALRYPIGGPIVMRDQLRHLAELGTRPNISIRIVPLSVGGFLGLQVGSFVLLDFPEHRNPALTESPVVYVEGYIGALYLVKPGEIDKFREARSEIAEAALDEDESRAMFLAIAEEYKG